MNMINRGLIPKDADVSPAFFTGSSSIVNKPIRLSLIRLLEKAQQYIKNEIQEEKILITKVQYDL